MQVEIKFEKRGDGRWFAITTVNGQVFVKSGDTQEEVKQNLLFEISKSQIVETHTEIIDLDDYSLGVKDEDGNLVPDHIVDKDRG